MKTLNSTLRLASIGLWLAFAAAMVPRAAQAEHHRHEDRDRDRDHGRRRDCDHERHHDRDRDDDDDRGHGCNRVQHVRSECASRSSISFGVRISNVPPPSCYYYDPYCDATFASLTVYGAHCRRHSHPRIIRVYDGNDWGYPVCAYRQGGSGIWMRYSF